MGILEVAMILAALFVLARVRGARWWRSLGELSPVRRRVGKQERPPRGR
jgi:hypothetical protein